MAGDGNEGPVGAHGDRLTAADQTLRSGRRRPVRLMDDALGAKFLGKEIRVGHIIPVSEKDVLQAAPGPKPIHEVWDKAR